MIILPVRWKASDSRWRQKHYFKCLSYAFLFFWCWLQSSAETHVSRCSLQCRYSSSRIIDFGTDSRYFRVFWHYLRRSCPLEERPHVCVCAVERKVENEGTAGSEAERTWHETDPYLCQETNLFPLTWKQHKRKGHKIQPGVSHCAVMRSNRAEQLSWSQDCMSNAC